MADKDSSATSTSALLEEGRLDDALAALGGRLRAHPADHAARTLFAELLCLSGAFDRAEAQLATVAQQTVDRPVAIARLRHLIRAATAREAWSAQGAVPALMGEPTALQRIAIELSLALRAADPSRTQTLLEQAEDTRPKLSGTADGQDFDDWRDADDRSAWFFEILTNDGGYLWVDPASIAGLRFRPAARPIDLLWRETRMSLHDGRVADVVVPAQYAATPQTGPAHRLGQETGWQAAPGGASIGLGQRLWLLGDEARGVLDLNEIHFKPTPS